jgi:hypothetical protein
VAPVLVRFVLASFLLTRSDICSATVDAGCKGKHDATNEQGHATVVWKFVINEMQANGLRYPVFEENLVVVPPDPEEHLSPVQTYTQREFITIHDSSQINQHNSTSWIPETNPEISMSTQKFLSAAALLSNMTRPLSLLDPDYPQLDDLTPPIATGSPRVQRKAIGFTSPSILHSKIDLLSPDERRAYRAAENMTRGKVLGPLESDSWQQAKNPTKSFFVCDYQGCSQSFTRNRTKTFLPFVIRTEIVPTC